MSFFGQYPIEGGGGGVTSLNGLTGSLTLIGAGGITITPSGSNITITGSPTAPAGSNTQVQYNNSGVFGASPHFTFTDSPSTLTLGTAGGSVIATATPTTLDLGNTYSSVAGTNIKLTLLDNTENQTGTGPYGLGVSASSMDLLSGSNFNFYSGGSKTIFISNAGIFPASAGTGLVGYSGGPFASVNANAFFMYDDSSDEIASFTEVSSGLQIMAAFPTAPLALLTAANSTGATGNINIITGSSTTSTSGSFTLNTGDAESSGGASGSINIQPGSNTGTGAGAAGSVNITGGASTTDPAGFGGSVNIAGGSSVTSANSGGVSIFEGGGDAGIEMFPTGSGSVNGVSVYDDAGQIAILASVSSRILYGSDGVTQVLNFTAPTLVTLGAVLQLFNAASDPGTAAAAGQIYFNTTTNVIRIYNGTTWQSVTAV